MSKPVMSLFHLAQFNIAWAVAPLDDPRMADHKAGLERTMHLAEKSSGFVWRHPDPLSIRIRDDDRMFLANTPVGFAGNAYPCRRRDNACGCACTVRHDAIVSRSAAIES